MPKNNDRSPYDSQLSDHTPPPTHKANHLYVIGTPPRGYQRVEEVSPFKRFIKEVHRLWVAPMLAGLPAWFDNWWKKGREGGAANKATAAGKALPLSKM